jgi:molecular chaperone DnaK (HSP70)
MILESFDYAESDIEQRQLIEARNEANTIIAAVDKAPSQPAWRQLTDDERTQIILLRDELSVLKDGDDLKLIREATSALDKATHRFAELMMDTAVASVLHGQTMESAGSSLGDAPTAPHPFSKAEFQ